MVKKQRPWSSKCLRRTILEDGVPFASAVARVMAFGSTMFDAMARSIQFWSWVKGSGWTSMMSSPDLV